jgi:hypothetical protein
MIGWSGKIMAPGPGFDAKKSITTYGWKTLVARIPAIWRNNPYRDEGMPELDIVVWPESTSNLYRCSPVVKLISMIGFHAQSRRPDDVGRIPLVIDGDGKSLRVVADTKTFSQLVAAGKATAPKLTSQWCAETTDESDSGQQSATPSKPGHDKPQKGHANGSKEYSHTMQQKDEPSRKTHKDSLHRLPEMSDQDESPLALRKSIESL